MMSVCWLRIVENVFGDIVGVYMCVCTYIYIQYTHTHNMLCVNIIRRPQPMARGSALEEKCCLFDHGPGENLTTEYVHQLGGFRCSVATSVGTVARLVAVEARAFARHLFLCDVAPQLFFETIQKSLRATPFLRDVAPQLFFEAIQKTTSESRSVAGRAG
jgi:hypothetical protein